MSDQDTAVLPQAAPAAPPVSPPVAPPTAAPAPPPIVAPIQTEVAPFNPASAGTVAPPIPEAPAATAPETALATANSQPVVRKVKPNELIQRYGKRPPVVNIDLQEIKKEDVEKDLLEPEYVTFEYPRNSSRWYAIEISRLGIDAAASVRYDALKGRIAASSMDDENPEPLPAANAREAALAAKARRAQAEAEGKPLPSAGSGLATVEGDTPHDVTRRLARRLTKEQLIALTESLPEMYEAQVKLLVPAITWWNVPGIEHTIDTFMTKGELATEAIKALVAWFDPTTRDSAAETGETPNQNSTSSSSTTTAEAGEAHGQSDSSSTSLPGNTAVAQTT